MKPLILSFFTVILLYSLFIDHSKNIETKEVKEGVEVVHISYSDSFQNIDSIVFFANKPIFSGRKNN